MSVDRMKPLLTTAEITPNAAEQPIEVYHLAHDLRGPLNSILGFTELLLDGIEGPLNEYQQADIAAINQSAQNLLHLINTVVDLSKVEANRLNVTIAPVDLLEAVDKVVTFDFGTVKPKHFKVITDLPAALPPAHAQASRVQQMLFGVLRFAFKMNTDSLTIRARHDDETVTLQIELGAVTLSEEMCTGIFQPKMVFDTAGHKHLGPGGVEMPLVRRLAEVQEAQVWVESSPDVGTSFYLKFKCEVGRV